MPNTDSLTDSALPMAEQIAKVRGGTLSPGIQAAINAMKRAIEEDRDPLA